MSDCLDAFFFRCHAFTPAQEQMKQTNQIKQERIFI